MNYPTLKDFKESNCLNCEYPFSGQEIFCPECGQKNICNKITLGNFITDVFAGFFSWDAKFWKTLTPLLIKPGKISKDYNEGKRARYTNPFRFYLTTSIIFFLLFGIKKNYKTYQKFSSKDSSLVIEKGEINRDSLQNVIFEGIDKTERQIDSLQAIKNDSTGLKNIKISILNNDNILAFIKFQNKHPKYSIDTALDSLKIEKSFSNRFWYSRSKVINSFISDKEEGEKFNSYLISYFSIALLILLPALALFLKMIYIRRRINYVEHLIFSFHTQTLAFILLSVLVILSFFSNIISGALLEIFSVFFLIYLYIAMLKFYEQKWFKTLVKFFIINLSFMLLFIFIIALFSIIGLVFYK